MFKMLISTTLLLSTTTFAQLKPGTASRSNLQRSDLDEPVYWVAGYFAVDRLPDDVSTMVVCNEFGGPQCQLSDHSGLVHNCVVPATDAMVSDMKKDPF